MTKAQRYVAQGSVRVGGAGTLQAHGLDVAFDGTAGRVWRILKTP